MSTITKEVVIEKSGRTVIELELPADFPIGKARVTLVPEAKNHVNRAAEVYGMGRGKVWTSDDFDAPLEFTESK